MPLESNNLLNGITLYLAGPIDNAADCGRGWRVDFKERCRHLGMNILDPTQKPGDLISETANEKEYARTLRAKRDWVELRKFAKHIRRVDLRFVDSSHAIVAYIDPDVHMFGTIDEIVTAERQRKPVFAIIKGGKQRASLWCFAIFRQDEMFDSVEECCDYIRAIDGGSIEMDDRWVIFHNSVRNTSNTNNKSEE